MTVKTESSPDPDPKQSIVMSRHRDYTVGQTTGGLSVLFTILCIVDYLGVFPVITLPKSIITCGFYGIPLVLGVMGLQLYTAALLGRSWLLAQDITPLITEKIRSPYAAIAELAFGPPARRVVIFLIDATVFGSGVPNFILAAQSMQIFWWKISGGSIGITYCVWMLLLGVILCPVMWLGSPKDMKPLALSSVFIVSTVAICTWTCTILDDVSPLSVGDLLDYQPQFGDFLMAYGILAFQFDIHPMLLTIQVDMRDSRKINTAVLGGFAITGMMFTITTILVAIRYGTDIDNNILQTIPPSIPLYLMALLVTLQLSLSSAVGNSALFQHIEDLLHISPNFCVQRCILRSSIVAVAIFLGETVPRFDLVMGLVGSTLTGPLMFIFPPLIFLRLSYMKSVKDENVGLSNRLKYGKTNDIKNGVSNGIKNGDSNGVQNGGHTKCPLIKEALQTKYKTFTSTYVEIHPRKDDEYSIKWYDVLLALIVMFMGVCATLVATYTSWANTIAYAEFSPPCLINATIAARSFLRQHVSI